MRKSTVYLADEMKQVLARLSATSGRSEAELIREAIAVQLQRTTPPRPSGALFASGDASLAQNVDAALAGFGER